MYMYSIFFQDVLEDENKMTYTWNEACTLLSKYILKNMRRLRVPGNDEVLLVKDDILGKALHVNSFSRSQV